MEPVLEPRSPVGQAHSTFLATRQAAQRGLVAAVSRQLAAQRTALGPPRPRFGPRELHELALGSVAACFGPEYAGYEGHRCPRIPNGDLMLMSRVVEVQARRGDLTPGAWLEAEYDLPPAPWYAADPRQAGLSTAILMELALQPCGFLSAFLDPTLQLPPEDWYFRNLDGSATLLAWPELSGQTIRCRASLRSSILLEGTIVQRFDFELVCAGQAFYRGEAVFGCFRAAALATQVGLDGGREVQPWYDRQLAAGWLEPHPVQPPRTQGDARLRLLDEVVVVPGGGEFGQGYALGRADIDPAAWFFGCHFYQDPVMPGSLGVEAIFQALEAGALALLPPGAWRRRLAVGRPLEWKYRGQLVPGERELRVEVHLKRVERADRGATVAGEASLWKADRRIYAVRDAAVELFEG